MGIFDRFFGPTTEDQFASLVIKAFRRAGDDRSSTYDKAEFRLLHHKDGKDCGITNLRSLYGEYCQVPKKERAAWLNRISVALLQQMGTDIPEDFEDVRPHLLPSVRNKAMVETMRMEAQNQGSEGFDWAVLPLSDHLIVCLVHDLPMSIRFVSGADLENWGISLYEAGEIARHNLEEKGFQYAAIGDKVYAFLDGDGFDATRMLLMDHVRSLKLTGDPVALPVARECLLITGAEDEGGLGMMLDLAEKEEGNPRPVCPIPHCLVGDEWQAWMPPADSPHLDRFRVLGLKSFYRDYAEQKLLLDKLNEKTGTDVFVASFSAVERNGRVLSYSVVSETVPTWLPKTDYVAFVAADQQNCGLVPWERVQATIGHSLRPLDYYPPRWFVTDFPTSDQLAAMKPENWST